LASAECGVEHCARHPSVQVYILGSSCLLTLCQFADFTAATYDSRLISFGGEAMRASINALAAALFLAATNGSYAASQLASKEIQAEFFNGVPFTSSTPSNTKFTMVFKADGKVTRKPQGKTGVGGEGTWKLSKDGFCTTWKGTKENCFTLVTVGEKKWSVMKGKASVGTWSK
jgi:hypothetical protein